MWLKRDKMRHRGVKRMTAVQGLRYRLAVAKTRKGESPICVFESVSMTRHD